MAAKRNFEILESEEEYQGKVSLNILFRWPKMNKYTFWKPLYTLTKNTFSFLLKIEHTLRRVDTS